MNAKDISITDINFRKLVQDENYYKYIFKKTEKVVSVVFYILNNVDVDKKTETHVSNIASKAHLVHEHSLRTLEVKRATGREVLEQFAQALIALESSFRVAAAVNLISPEVLRTVVGEIELIMRGLRAYLQTNEAAESDVRSFSSEPAPVRNTPRLPRSREPREDESSIGTARSASSAADRRERIKTIIEAKGEATIKDISEIVSDVSEKTIQRELQAMIEDNIIKRQGERRWSKYSLF